jgi:hypothetical protein
MRPRQEEWMSQAPLLLIWAIATFWVVLVFAEAYARCRRGTSHQRLEGYALIGLDWIALVGLTHILQAPMPSLVVVGVTSVFMAWLLSRRRAFLIR